MNNLKEMTYWGFIVIWSSNAMIHAQTIFFSIFNVVLCSIGIGFFMYYYKK